MNTPPFYCHWRGGLARLVSLVVITSAAYAPLACGSDGDAVRVFVPPAPVTDAAAPDAAVRDASLADARVAPDDASPVADAASDGSRADAGPDAAGTNACAAANGICLGSATSCTSAGGAVAASGNPGCVFSDGPGTCCVPPAPQPAGTTCASHGGVCAPIVGCNFVKGAFAPPSCGAPGVVCCVPNAVCGDEEQVCCEPGGSVTFRASCNRGAWECTISGTQLKPRSACP